MSSNDELRTLREENERLQSESQSVAIANVRAGIQMAEISLERQAQLEARQIELEAALELARIAAQEKDEFLAKVTHELRTPLNGSIGMIQVLLQSSLTDGQRECASIALQSSQSLLGLINMILDASAIRAGRVNLDASEFDPWTVVEGVARTLAAQAGEKDLGLYVDIDPATPRGVVGDANRLRQVLLNLVGNALKFTQHGAVRIRLRSRSRVRGQVEIRFAVIDTGPGISASAQEILFDDFVQGDNTMARRFGGSGLGLSIVKGLVDRMGGRMTVRSRVGCGSAFSFSIVLATAEVAEPTEAPRGRLVVLSEDKAQARCICTHFSFQGVGVDIIESADSRDLPSCHERDSLLVDQPHASPAQLQRTCETLGSKLGVGRIILVRSVGQEALEGRDSVLRPLSMSEVGGVLWGRTSSQGSTQTSAPRRKLEGLRILVVDDQPVNQRVAKLWLQRLGAEVELADDGKVAVAAWTKGSFDTILMDCQMPEMDGMEATEIIRAIEREQAGQHRTPILALTANTSPGDKARCLIAGMDGVLAKPIDVTALIQTILEQVEGDLGCSGPKKIPSIEPTPPKIS